MKLLLWLGILAAPFIGLMAGTWLTPVPVIVWDASCDHPVHHVLGFVDQGSILLRLVADRERTVPTTMSKMEVQGLDASMGVRRITLPVPEELRCSWTREGYPQLTEDGSAILFMMHQQAEPAGNRIVLYDWRKQQIIRQFHAEQYRTIHRVTYRNGTLIARASGFGEDMNKEFLLAWYGDAVKPSAMPLVAFQAFISEDGTHVAVTSDKNEPLRILDVKKNVILQKLDGFFSGIRWLSGNQQFLAIVEDHVHSTSSAQRFTLQNDKYVPEQSQLVLMHTPAEFRFATNHLLVRSHTMYESWRKELKSYLGENIGSMFNTWWPEGSIRQLRDPNTGELLQRLVLPQTYIRTGMTANPTNNTLAVFDETQVCLWRYPTSGTYYPLIGIVIGLAISALFFHYWLTLRKQAIKSQPMMYLRRNMPQPEEAASDSPMASSTPGSVALSDEPVPSLSRYLA